MKKSAVVVICSIVIVFFLVEKLQGGNVLTAETKMFLTEWNSYKQKAPNSSSIEELQERFGLILGATLQTGTLNVKAEEWLLPVIASFGSEQEMEENLSKAEEKGFLVQTKLKTICTGYIPAEKINEVGFVNGIKQIQASGKLSVLLDKSRDFSRVSALQQLHQQDPSANTYRGEGVVIGVVDEGFDYAHPTFYDIDDTSIYRVKKVWNQNQEGTPPTGYQYGKEYKTKDEILSAKYSINNTIHGSHVAGIAAGSGAGTPFIGMAPKADLVFVSTKFTLNSILDGVVYIHNYAKEKQQPCVVNLSLGFHLGPHDGTSAFDRALDEIKEAGLVVVGAAGNDGESKLHVGHTFTANTKDTLFYTQVLPTIVRDPQMFIDVWSNGSEAIEMEMLLLEQESGEIKWRSDFCSSLFGRQFTRNIQVNGTNYGQLIITPEIDAFSGKHRLYTYIGATRGITAYSIVLAVKSHETSANAAVNMWNSNGNFGLCPELQTENPIKDGTNEYTVVEGGGTSKSILSAGSYNTKSSWTNTEGKVVDQGSIYVVSEISPFSSIGPTADGRTKPDITAPGAVIASSFNSYSPYPAENEVYKVTKGTRAYPFGIAQGTSMASPAVAGMVALCLQVRPDWQIDSVRLYLAETAMNDKYTGEVRNNPSNMWGMGKIDAYALLEKAEQKKLYNEPTKDMYAQLAVYPNPGDGRFYVKIPQNENGQLLISLLDQQGKCVFKKYVSSADDRIYIEQGNLPKGLYLLRVDGSKSTYSAKVIIK